MRMKLINLSCLFILIIIFFNSCNCGRNIEETHSRRGSIIPVTVYAGGSEVINFRRVATYWKNGEPVYLSSGSKYNANILSMVVSGDDVHAAGYGDGVAKYWKTSGGKVVREVVLSRNSTAWSIAVFGNDVYVLGKRKNGIGKPFAVCWKNEKVVSQIEFHEVYAMFVNNNDIYFAGCKDGNATYWKNGEPVPLSGGTCANLIQVVGDDIYAAGYEEYDEGESSQAIYWKNGLIEPLSLGNYVSSIFVDGKDVYVAGSVNRGAAYWKNGKVVILGEKYSSTRSIFVFDKDVYVGGSQFGIAKAVYWKNGELVSLSENSSDVNSIVVVPQN